jgi:hypothetical protein
MDFAPIAAVLIAVLAWDHGRRYLDYRRSLLLELSRLDKIEAEFKTHRETHAVAIKNLVEEMRTAIGEVKTKSSLALERANGAKSPRRFG